MLLSFLDVGVHQHQLCLRVVIVWLYFLVTYVYILSVSCQSIYLCIFVYIRVCVYLCIQVYIIMYKWTFYHVNRIYISYFVLFVCMCIRLLVSVIGNCQFEVHNNTVFYKFQISFVHTYQYGNCKRIINKKEMYNTVFVILLQPQF